MRQWRCEKIQNKEIVKTTPNTVLYAQIKSVFKSDAVIVCGWVRANTRLSGRRTLMHSPLTGTSVPEPLTRNLKVWILRSSSPVWGSRTHLTCACSMTWLSRSCTRTAREWEGEGLPWGRQRGGAALPTHDHHSPRRVTTRTVDQD